MSQSALRHAGCKIRRLCSKNHSAVMWHQAQVYVARGVFSSVPDPKPRGAGRGQGAGGLGGGVRISGFGGIFAFTVLSTHHSEHSEYTQFGGWGGGGAPNRWKKSVPSSTWAKTMFWAPKSVVHRWCVRAWGFLEGGGGVQARHMTPPPNLWYVVSCLCVSLCLDIRYLSIILSGGKVWSIVLLGARTSERTMLRSFDGFENGKTGILRLDVNRVQCRSH